jgi:phosphinothricin acetyltransferase
MMVQIRDARAADADAIARIYNHYIRDTIITFEETDVTPQEMARRIAEVTVRYPWLVGEENGAVAGYAYGAQWADRSAYRHSVQSSIYLAHDATGRGLGTQLYQALLARLRQQPIHAVLGGISLPNAASVALHEKCGFEKVAHFSEVGFKFGRWIDVGYWQITL